MTALDTTREFMTSQEVSAATGFSLNALANWRKRRVGPRWRRAAKGDHYARPLYYTEDVKKLRDAILLIRGMRLRTFPNVAIPEPSSGGP